MVESDKMTSALNICMIGDCVGSYLSETDLKSCRLVSKDWYDWSSPPLRKKSRLYVRNLNDLQKLVKHPDDNYKASPHRQVVFKLKKMEGVKVTKAMAEFWSVHGPGLRFLMLKNVESCGLDILLDILYRRTPMLKTLILYKCFDTKTFTSLARNMGASIDADKEQTNEKLTHLKVLNPMDVFLTNDYKLEFLSQLVLRYPKLKTLQIDHYFHAVGPLPGPLSGFAQLEQLFAKMGNVRVADVNRYRIKNLNIAGVSFFQEQRIDMPFLRSIEAMQFPLETLTLDFGINIEPELLAALLELYKGTLKKLAAYRIYSRLDQTLGSFPFRIQLDSLQVLRISDCLVATMQFLKYTPNLEVLHICGWGTKDEFRDGKRSYPLTPNCIHRTHESVMRGVTAMHLREFRIESVQHVTGDMRFRFHKWMPVLERIVTHSNLREEDLEKAATLFD